MKITNKFNLPASLVRAVESHTHTGGDYSASALGKSPREYWLAKRHQGSLESDVSENVWSLFGSAVHSILESSATKDQLVEQYMKTEINGKSFTGIADCLEKCDGGYKIIDYKTTSAWTIIYKDRLVEWERQLNAYAYLFGINDFDVKEISVIAILRDWSRTKAKVDPNYPQSQVLEISLKVWDTVDQLAYIADNIERIEGYKEDADNDLPDCTDAELWKSPAKYAIKKEGRKSAVRVLDSEVDAENYIEVNNLDNKHSIEHRPSKAKKCSYCNARVVCNQYKVMAEKGEVDE